MSEVVLLLRNNTSILTVIYWRVDFIVHQLIIFSNASGTFTGAISFYVGFLFGLSPAVIAASFKNAAQESFESWYKTDSASLVDERQYFSKQQLHWAVIFVGRLSLQKCVVTHDEMLHLFFDFFIIFGLCSKVWYFLILKYRKLRLRWLGHKKSYLSFMIMGQ